MQKVRRKPKRKKLLTSEVTSFYKYRNARMARFTGNFMGGGFNVTQSKVKAILDNIEIMREFVNGVFDENIDELTESEILEL